MKFPAGAWHYDTIGGNHLMSVELNTSIDSARLRGQIEGGIKPGIEKKLSFSLVLPPYCSINIFLTYGTNQYPTFSLVANKYSQCYNGMGLRQMNKSNEDDGPVSEYYLKLFPNPNSGRMELTYNLPADEVCTLEIVDPLGRIVYRSTIDPDKNSEIIELNNISRGPYFYRVYTPVRILDKGRLVIIKQ